MINKWWKHSVSGLEIKVFWKCWLKCWTCNIILVTTSSSWLLFNSGIAMTMSLLNLKTFSPSVTKMLLWPMVNLQFCSSTLQKKPDKHVFFSLDDENIPHCFISDKEKINLSKISFPFDIVCFFPQYRQLMVIVKNNIYAWKSCSNHQEPLEEIVGKVAKPLVDNFWQPFHPQLTCVVHSNFPETPLLRQACDAIMLWMASSMIQEVLPKTRAMGLMEIEKLPSCSEIWTTSSIFANRCFVVLREITFEFSLHFFTLLMLVKVPNFFFFIRSKN